MLHIFQNFAMYTLFVCMCIYICIFPYVYNKYIDIMLQKLRKNINIHTSPGSPVDFTFKFSSSTTTWTPGNIFPIGQNWRGSIHWLAHEMSRKQRGICNIENEYDQNKIVYTL